MNLEALLGLLQGQNLGKLAEQIGGTDGQTKNAIMAALPALLGALNKNSNTPEGAQTLNNALEQHDGSVLNNVEGYLQNPDLKDGAGILSHLFGGNAVSQSSGLDTQGSLKMLETLAPLVLGALGQQKKENNLDAQGISNLTSNIAANFTGEGGIMSMITNYWMRIKMEM